MNRAALLATIPTNGDLHAMPGDEIRRRAENLVDGTLIEIENDGRDPDAWEADMLFSALGAVYHRRNWLALACAEKALVPPHERSGAARHHLDRPVTIQELRDALTLTRGLAR